jgi:tricorn protease interacting factor F2/3
MVEVSSYEINLSFKDLHYQGTVKITLSTDEDLFLDSVNHDVKSVKADGRELPFSREGDIIHIKTGKFSGTLEVQFEADVDQDGIVGIYKAPYEGGYMISTQFEANYARRFIPCIDDPSKKAKFLLTVEVDKNKDVISNMPVKEVIEKGDRKIVKFHETPKMSTYLLYLGIGNFEEIKEEFRFPLVLATVPGKSVRGKFSLSIAKESIEFYENYFSIPYQLPKMHLIAVPEFSAGAMENWGAITFREIALLVSDKSPFSLKRRVSITVAHELAHQWFGDLVTMKWWDDLWLNESFATFMSHKAMEDIRKDWDAMGYFVSIETAEAMERDSLFTHPIHVPVKTPDEIEEIFDDISYGKGASILRMIEAYIGKENFRKGVSEYLRKFSFSNAEASDLWTSLSQASGKDVNSIMEEWITHEGYPMLRVSPSEGGKVRITQERFSLVKAEDRLYMVPVTAIVDGKQTQFLMDDKETYLEGKKVKLNLDRTGFYRVFYEDLESFFKSDPNPMERWGLINDYFAFLLKGIITPEEYVYLVKRMESEEHYLPAGEVASQLTLLYNINSDKWSLAKDIISNYVAKWENRKSDVDRQTYASMIASLSYMDRDFAAKVSTMMDNMESLVPEMKDAVVIAYSVANGEKGFEKLMEMYKNSKFDEEKLRYLRGMLASHEPHLIANTLNMSLSGEVKKQDIPFMVIWGSIYPRARDVTWEWFKAHMERISKYYEGTPRMGVIMSNILPFVGLKHEDALDIASEIKSGKSFVEVGKQKLELYRKLL